MCKRTSVSVSFNGEIFNYPELRPELEREATVLRPRLTRKFFCTCSKSTGPTAFRALNGQFALAIWE